jgi:hypothetical protein
MSENLVELAQRFVRLSSELDATRDAMGRLLLNGAGPNENPTPARGCGVQDVGSGVGDAAILLAGLSGPRSPGNRRGDLLAWSMTPEVHTGRHHRASVLAFNRSCQPRSVGPPAVSASGERRLRFRGLRAFQPPHRPCPEISRSSFLLTLGSTPATSQEATRP